MEDLQVKKNTWFVTLLIALIFGVMPLFYLSKLLDIGHTSRFLFLSACLLLFFIVDTPKFRFTLLELVLVAYYFWNLVSITWSQNFADAIFQAQKIFIVFTLFLFIKHVIQSENVIYKAICLANIVVLCVGLKQLILLPSFHIYDIYGAIGLQCHKNLYASLLFLFSPFLILGYINHQELIWKKSFVSVLFLNLVVMVILQTRAVYVGLAIFTLVVTCLSLWTLKQHIQIKLIVKICAFLFCALGTAELLYESKSHEIPEKYKQIGSPRIASINERLGIWKNTQSLIQENSMLGVGIGSWPLLYPKFGLAHLHRAQTENVVFQNPHNDFLWVWSEVGTIGLLLILVVYIGFVFMGIKALFLKSNPIKTRIEILVLIGAFVGFQAISFFDFPKERMEHLLMSTALMVFIGFKAKWNDTILHPPPWCKIFVIALLGLNLKISWSRIQGEIHTGDMYVARARGDWRTLLEACDKAKSTFYNLDPTAIPIDWYRGVGNFSLGNVAEALLDFQEAYRLNRYNFHILNNLASTHETLGNHDLAKKYYTEALRINPLFEEAKLNLFVIFFNEHDYASASNILKSCTQESDRRTQYLQLLYTKSSQK